MKLDATAKAHADWQLVNNYDSHYEEAIKSSTGQPTVGFTGVFSMNRAVYAGYATSTNSFSIGDDYVILMGTTNKTLYGGEHNVRSLLEAPYHQRSMLGAFREIGIANRSSDDVGVTNTLGQTLISQYDLANTNAAGKQLPASNEILTYPCQGSTGTAYSMSSESPAVLAGRNYSQFPTGQPVFITVRQGQSLVITSASMSVTSTSATVPLQAILTSANDRNALFQDNEAMIIPDVALAPNTQYSVAITGTNAGQAFTRAFTFTTGTVH